MKVLIVNKFLHPNGGSETYIFEVGKQLQKMGHQVEYFGMEHEGRVVSNRLDCYTGNMDFHTGKLQNYGIRSRFSIRQRLQKRSGKCWTTFSRTWFMSIISIFS